MLRAHSTAKACFCAKLVKRFDHRAPLTQLECITEQAKQYFSLRSMEYRKIPII